MLYLVGLGLADEKDITVKGLEIVKKAARVYLEAYTAVLLVEKDVLVSAAMYAQMQDSEANCRDSRKPSMAAKSSSPTVKWSSRPATIYSKTPTRAMSHSSW